MALPSYTPERRREVAAALEIEEQYLYQILRGIRTASPALARELNRIDSSFSLSDLRPDDWMRIWPELARPKRSKARLSQSAGA
jgi:DNA-binding transcriptional regulator YdaS (Cro superfamily)